MDDILFAKNFAQELEAESPATLKCLARIPPELFGWKPHEKSMEMGYLALLVAEIPLWIAHIVTKAEIDFAAWKHIAPKTTGDLVDHFKENVAGAKQALLQIKDGGLAGKFYLKANGKELMSTPKKESIGQTINHLVHHRGQLTVYMRLNNILVPSIYGPSADDKSYTSH